jgi:pseudomonalisin
MHVKNLRLLTIALLLLVSATAFAANHLRAVNDNDTVPVFGNIHRNARPEFDEGPASLNMPYEKMILVLRPRDGARADIDRLLIQLHDPASPMYHQWLSPEEYGKRFGVSDADLADVTSWLSRRGFKIEQVAPGRGWINFSGTVGDVERAFKTEIRNYRVDGREYHANDSDPQIPRALADVVAGIVSLHNFPRQPMNHGFKTVSDYSNSERKTGQYTSGTGNHYVSPGDFATIYNVKPLYTAGINGTGQTIAIVGRTDIALGDVQFFRSFFGLPANDPVFVHNGVDPGNLGGGEEGEADLDVQWSGAVAPNATIKFVISKSTTSTDGVDLSAQYIINNNVAKVMSTSFGQCESTMGTTENNFYNNLWSQGATQGITSFVSSGDSGAAGCNGGSDTTGSGAAVSGLASTPFNVAVGGSQFNDTASPSTYWNATNATDNSSAKGYIPEIAWNESANVTGGSGLWASAGGASSIYVKPSWQVCLGVPAANHRYIPDISLTAAGHDGYLVFQGHTTGTTGLGAVGGTSASSPSFAGLMALVNQKTGTSWGNANTKFYALAAAQYAGTGVTMFHDVTSGNNSVPGVTGFTCGTGYDAVTGVGTVDANAMVNNWTAAPAPDFAMSASPTSVSVVQGNSGNSTITTTVSGGFNSAVALTSTGAPSGATVTFTPASIAAPGSGTSTMTVSVAGTTAVGTYTITVTGSGGSKTHTSTVTLTVTAAAVPDFAISTSPTSKSIAQGASSTVTVSTTVSGGFNAAVALTSSGAPAGTTVSFAPTSIAAPGSGSSTATITVGASTAAGTYTITVTGTGGSQTHSATVSLTVTATGGITQLLLNPGFESGAVNWTTTSGVIDSSTGEASHSGTWKAWMDGYGSSHTDTVLQQVAIPAGKTSATLTFWLHVDSAETTTSTAYDTVKVQVRNSSGTVLATLATYSNLNKATGYTQKSFNLNAYIGQTVQIFLTATEDTSLQTSFVVDDFALNVQ